MTVAFSRGSAAVQGALSGTAAEDWAVLMEPQGRALFEAVLCSGAFTPGARGPTSVAGAGCSRSSPPAADQVIGLDAPGPLLEIARRRTPGATFHQGDLEALPFTDEGFDVVTRINAIRVRRAARPG